MENKKTILALKELLSRQNYLVVQGNDLARSFGNLSSFEHKILDYCFSFVTKDSKINDDYELNTIDIIRHLGLNSSGQNYLRIAKALKKLNENTALYFKFTDVNGQKGVLMTQLFRKIIFFESGKISFTFSKEASPYIFDLRKNYYSFKLAELSRIKGKYALIMIKLWEANKIGNMETTTVKGTLEEWQTWFLGKDNSWTAGRFKDKVINIFIKELEEKLNFSFLVNTLKQRRKVIGYEIVVFKKK